MTRRITDLEQHTAPAPGDQTFILDNLTGRLKRISLAALLSGLGGVASGIRLDFGVFMAGASPGVLAFDVPFADANYAFLVNGVKGGDPVDVTIGTASGGTKSPAQITISAAAEDTEVWWLALGRAA